MSDLPPEDRQRLIKSTFQEYASEFLRSDDGKRILDDYVQSLKEVAGSESPSSPPPLTRTQPQSPQNGGSQRVSAFEKFLLGR
jgi:hypothetical protein